MVTQVFNFFTSLFAVIRMDFVYGVLSAIILSVCGKIGAKIYYYINNRPAYSISGYWISEYQSAFSIDMQATDILHIMPFKNKLLITYHQYTNKDKDIVHIWSGEGYVSNNNSRIAISYFYESNNGYQNGVMLLTHIDVKSTLKALSGKFYEFDNRAGHNVRGQTIEGSELKIYPINYKAYRFSLSVRQKISFHLGKKVFASYYGNTRSA